MFGELPLDILIHIYKYVGCPNHFVKYKLNPNCRCTLRREKQKKYKHLLDTYGKKRTNDYVILRWMNDLPAKSFRMSTDGYDLYSYNLKIGYTDNLLKVALNYTAKGGIFYSMTTSTHCNKAKEHADEILRLK